MLQPNIRGVNLATNVARVTNELMVLPGSKSWLTGLLIEQQQQQGSYWPRLSISGERLSAARPIDARSAKASPLVSVAAEQQAR